MEQLWSNERITEAANEMGYTWWHRDDGLAYMKMMRDEYEAERAALVQRIAQLEDEPNEALEDFRYQRAQAEAWAKAERGE